MKKTSTITINDKIITVNELTVRQIMGIKDSFSGSNTLEAMQAMLPMITDATPDFLLDLAPSELADLWDKAKEVNASFLAVLPLDKLLVGYQETIVQTIQTNLQKLSAGSLQQVMDQQPTATDGVGF